MKKLPKALAAVGLLAPMSVYALGVGDIKLQSALNQQLNAEIPLITSRSEVSSDIKVSLASPKAFKRAGIDRQFYLSNIRFKTVVRNDGSVVIKVSSHEIVREPFLNFLVEVNWPQGRALKEFTVLLDPPVMLNESEPVIQKAPVARRTGTSVVSSGDDARSVSIAIESDSPVSGEPPSELGPTKKNDTLWGVAARVNHDASVSHKQMMMSLFEKNRHAFYKSNVNALKRGVVLKVPTREEALKLTKKEASRAFSEHYKTWTAQLSTPEPVTPASSAEIKENSNDNADEELAVSEIDEESQLTLVTPADETAVSEAGPSTQDSGAGGTAEPRVDIAIEMAETVSQENEELQRRMSDLEQQIATMQRLLVLKDEQLATIQAKQNDTAESVDAEENGADSEVAAERSVAPKEVVETPFYANPLYQGLGGAALLGMILLSVRRKRVLEDEVIMAESILAVPDEPAENKEELIAPVIDSADIGVDAPAESSFLSEFTPSDFDSLDSGNTEVDPITEADVYLAYGRYQQAEDLVRKAIEDSPDQPEYKLKLLEILFATEDKSAFLLLANELHADFAETSPDLWDKVIEMGQDLCPEEALFQEIDNELSGETEASDEEDGSALDNDDVVLGGIEVGGQDVVEDSILDDLTEEEPESEALEFDAGLGVVDEAVAEIDDQGLLPESEENVTDFGSTDEEPAEIIPDNSINFAFEAETESESESEIETEKDDQEVSQESSENVIDFGSSPELPADEESEVEESDDFSFDFEMVPPAVEEGSEQERQDEDDSLNFEDNITASLTDMDEIETKLDLAKAYVDMEDEASAKGILQEVLEQGNEEQKAEAQSLLDKISS